jgi:SAM-dependent methyltransferase
MKWHRAELDRLFPVLEQISADLYPVDGKNILVLCSGMGEVVFWLAEMMETGMVTGLELDPDSLEIGRRSARELGLGEVAKFQAAERDHIPFPEAYFDALVSEIIVYPSTAPAEIGLPEMKRVLKPGGKLILTDVIVTKPLPQKSREELQTIGLDHLSEGTQADFQKWMAEAGFVDVKVVDLTPTVRQVWELRRLSDHSAVHWMGYSTLLEDDQLRLGKGIFYIGMKGKRPEE